MDNKSGSREKNTECQPCAPCPKIIKVWIAGLVILNTLIVGALAWQWFSRVFA